MAEVMVQNVAYRATVYRTGGKLKSKIYWPLIKTFFSEILPALFAAASFLSPDIWGCKCRLGLEGVLVRTMSLKPATSVTRPSIFKLASASDLSEAAALILASPTWKWEMQIRDHLYIMQGCFWPFPYHPPTPVRNSKYFYIPPTNITCDL